MGGVRWERAVHHLGNLAAECERVADATQQFDEPDMFRVEQLWAYGALLEAPHDLQVIRVALVVNRPPEDVAWFAEPSGAEWFANSTRLSKNPISAKWRSNLMPVWNHRIDRPALVWDRTQGVYEPVLAAIRDGNSESVRIPAPTRDEFVERLQEELAISRQAMRKTTEEYDDKRWSPGKLAPQADAMWAASAGYLDVLDALEGLR